MFLATTSLSEFWDTKSEILFLGEWCKRYDKRNDWINLNYEMLPFHWDDGQKRYTDFLYIRELSDRFLDQLTGIFNSIHCTRLSKGSWRIIVGQWLRHFIEQVFDRYQCIEMAKSSFVIHSTWNTETKIEEFTPRDMVGFYSNQGSEAYNLCLFSEIIRYRQDIPYIEKRRVNMTHKDSYGEPGLIRLAKQKIREVNNYIAGSNKRYFLYSTYMPLLDEMKLQISLGQFVSHSSICGIGTKTPKNTDFAMRRQIKLEATNEFEEFLSRILPTQIPKAYLENYHFLRNHSHQVFGGKPKIILTTLGHLNDEFFKIWAADMVEEGSKLYISQHGGHYGICKYSSSYEHEVEIADKFFTWGWSDDNKKVIPAPGLRLLHINTTNKINNSQKILWVLSSIPRYSERMYSIPTGPQWLNYIRDQVFFYEYLDEAVRNKLVCRPFVHEYGWHERSRLQDKFPDLKFDSREKPIHKIRKNYSLIVETCNQTTFLESLSANHPTIVFWDTTLWELSAAEKLYIDELHNAGIFFSDPIEAAEHINSIHGHIHDWWNQGTIQNARAEFCKKFAYRDDNWLKIWKQLLIS